MGIFERYLSVWIALAMVAGLVIGNVAPGLVETIAAAEFASVNLVVAVLIWAMVYPMMVGVDPGSLRDVARQPRGLLITLVVNWLIKPFTMAALAVVFFQYVFAPWIKPEDATQYIVTRSSHLIRKITSPKKSVKQMICVRRQNRTLRQTNMNRQLNCSSNRLNNWCAPFAVPVSIFRDNRNHYEEGYLSGYVGGFYCAGFRCRAELETVEQ